MPGEITVEHLLATYHPHRKNSTEQAVIDVYIDVGCSSYLVYTQVFKSSKQLWIRLELCKHPAEDKTK